MSAYAERYRKVAGQFTERVVAGPADAWDNPAPCEGWVARDVVRHLVEWVPGFFSNFAGLELPTDRSVDDDPVAAWIALDGALQAAVDDPAVESREFEMGGTQYSVAQAIDQFCTNDIVVHIWDLARATGQNETLDPDEVHALLAAMEPTAFCPHEVRGTDRGVTAKGWNSAVGPRLPSGPWETDQRTDFRSNFRSVPARVGDGAKVRISDLTWYYAGTPRGARNAISPIPEREP